MKYAKGQLNPPLRHGNTSSKIVHYRFDEYYVNSKQLYVTVTGGAVPAATSRLSSSAFRCRSSVIWKEDSYSK
jgi:hypothetical protein